MEARSVSLERAWAWFERGWQVFARHPFKLLLLVLAYTLTFIGPVLWSPYTGVVWLLWPFVYGGTFYMLQRSEQNGLRITDILKPFGMSGVRMKLFGLALLTIALYAFLGTAAVTMVQGAKFAMASTPGLWDHIGAVIIILSGLVSTILFVFIQLMTVYAAPLIMFHALGPFQSLSASFNACSRNWQAFLVFGCLLGLIALALAVVLLFLGWVAIGTIKARDPMAAMGGVGAMIMRPNFLLGSSAVVCLLGVPIAALVLCAAYASYVELFAEN